MSRAARNPPPVPRIALTGGVASGKSTVARLFETLGARIIDTDRVARDIVAPPSPVLDGLVARFGTGILMPDGTLNRALLRQIVFSDSAARRDLEAIMHPAIRAETRARSAAAGGPYQLILVPLLLETGTQGDYDRVLLVDVDEAVQLQRLMARDHASADAARSLMAAQTDRASRLAIADDVIRNDADVAALAPQVEILHRRYLQLTPGLSASTDSTR
ncbi:MAG TPA: dephospho-CoA kinase [Steroidobacteraceae bacterium]|nr:dephospho-CoA kinase [Steroidobacteraceae bacterium]